MGNFSSLSISFTIPYLLIVVLLNTTVNLNIKIILLI